MDYDDFLAGSIKSGLKTSNKQEAADKARKMKGFKTAVHCSYDVLRMLAKKGNVNAILPKWGRKDYYNQKLSGLDEPLLKDCSLNKIAVIFRFEDILSVKGEDRSVAVGKLSQNAMLCAKLRVPYFICSGKKKKDKFILTAFGNMLGLEGKKGVKDYPATLIGDLND